MKKAMFIILLMCSPSSQAGLWEKLSTLDLPTKALTSSYLVEAPGWNLRVVEWVPANNPNYVCLFAGGSKKGGVACFPKEIQK